MKTCAICSRRCGPNVPHCPGCGEATWTLEGQHTWEVPTTRRAPVRVELDESPPKAAQPRRGARSPS